MSEEKIIGHEIVAAIKFDLKNFRPDLSDEEVTRVVTTFQESGDYPKAESHSDIINVYTRLTKASIKI